MSLHAFLLEKSRDRFAATLRVVENLPEEDALRDSRPDWPRHDYWVGQDGSIAGIVHHLAAWRDAYCELLRGRNVEPTDLHPPAAGWPGLKQWLAESADDWLSLVESIPESESEVPLNVPGVSLGLTPLKMMWEMLEHEIEHSGQITYILESRKCAQ